MDPNIGHLVSGEKLREFLEKEPEKKERYKPIPEHLERAAQKKLAGKEEAMVSLTSGGKLSQWAAQERKEKTRKNARKTSAASRKKNRGK
jgi:ABC-type enterochelin transport system substrate-binding protein